MKNKYFNLLLLSIIFLVFVFGILVGHYHIFPYSYIKVLKNIEFGATVPLENDDTNFDLMVSCISSDGITDASNEMNDFQYTFFAAGHTYGTPGTVQIGLYPKFYESLLNSSKERKFDFGFLTGDVVRSASIKSWEVITKQLSSLPFEIHIAPGNHDVGNGDDNAKRDIFKIIHGETYYSFYKFSDLFIVLDPNISGWDIDGEQLIFLKEVLANNLGRQNNIFILMHQLIWASHGQDKYFKKIIYNSPAGKRDGPTNYWSVIAPLLEQQKNGSFEIQVGKANSFILEKSSLPVKR